jgi:hypothetical protein
MDSKTVYDTNNSTNLNRLKEILADVKTDFDFRPANLTYRHFLIHQRFSKLKKKR